MKKIIVILIVVLIAMEGIGWWVYKVSKKNDTTQSIPNKNQEVKQETAKPSTLQSNQTGSIIEDKQKVSDTEDSESQLAISSIDGKFPPPSVELINGIAQRTIHMGVRQWAWDPNEITAKYGEKVVLIMHNADVRHSISIPDLNVSEEIPEEGAIVKFDASKRGTFDFFCNVPCGSGHAKMKGKIIIN